MHYVESAAQAAKQAGAQQFSLCSAQGADASTWAPSLSIGHGLLYKKTKGQVTFHTALLARCDHLYCGTKGKQLYDCSKISFHSCTHTALQDVACSPKYVAAHYKAKSLNNCIHDCSPCKNMCVHLLGHMYSPCTVLERPG